MEVTGGVTPGVTKRPSMSSSMGRVSCWNDMEGKGERVAEISSSIGAGSGRRDVEAMGEWEREIGGSERVS